MSSVTADVTKTAPAPPALVQPTPPSLEHNGEPTEPEPSLPRGRATRGNAPGALVENGENGAGAVEDHTDATYDLLQDSVAGQGDFAFHLATRFDHWFKPTASVSVTAGCKLFFQSRLGWATSAQVATVQISTNGGSTWGNTVWTQAGDGGSGEGGFTLKEINLDAFIGQSIQVRFLYDFNGGSAFPQTEVGVGWYVDNIQIGSAFSKEEYTSFGEPSDDEQLYLEYINRARASATAEATRLGNESDPLVTNAYSNFNITAANLSAQFAWHVSSGCMEEFAQPLSFNSDLLQMAKLHTQDLFENAFQGHVSSASPPAPFQAGDTLGQRLAHFGYSAGAGENVYSYSKSVAHGHAGFDVDWGSTTNTDSACYNASFAGQGMQNPPGHRLSIHNADFREVGIGVINGSNGGVGPQLVTQNFGTGGSTVITGVVYQDLNSNNFYDPGEGLSGVRVETPDSAFYSITSASGGYAIPVDSNGTHPVTFSGGGVPTSTANAVVADGNNTKLDYLPTAQNEDYATWASALGVTGGESGDHDNDGVLNLIEYALEGFDPLVPDAHRLPKLVDTGSSMTFTLSKNTDASGLSYTVETSTNLTSWNSTGYTVLSDTAESLEISITPSAATALFVRASIEQAP